MKTTIKILILLISITTTAQEAITFNLSQDAKLLFVGDNKGNKAGTLDINIASEWQGKQFNGYYFFVRPEFEYAKLKGGNFKRYSANIGWTFNEWIENVSFTTSAGFGITTYTLNYISLGANLQTSYRVLKNLDVFIDLEFIDRKDLQIYEKEKISIIERTRISGKLGIKYSIPVKY